MVPTQRIPCTERAFRSHLRLLRNLWCPFSAPLARLEAITSSLYRLELRKVHAGCNVADAVKAVGVQYLLF